MRTPYLGVDPRVLGPKKRNELHLEIQSLERHSMTSLQVEMMRLVESCWFNLVSGLQIVRQMIQQGLATSVLACTLPLWCFRFCGKLKAEVYLFISYFKSTNHSQSIQLSSLPITLLIHLCLLWKFNLLTASGTNMHMIKCLFSCS